MCHGMIDQLAAIHAIDLRSTGLERLGDGQDFLTRELDRWAGDMRRVARGPLPALERVLTELRARQPEQSHPVTLVHGDMKPGNFAFAGAEVAAVFDWEMAGVGDPLTDLGYFEVLWEMRVGLSRLPGAPTADELIARYRDLRGIDVQHREWYRAMQAFKLAVIMLLGSMLFDAGHSDDLRLVAMGYGVTLMTGLALRDLGIDDELESGPVQPRQDRVDTVRAMATTKG
jgi:aminoglycoside phosphotransferase (APT) family kinase protein